MELELIANQYEEGLLILKFVPTNFNNRSPKVSNAGTTCTMSLSHSSSQHYAIHAPNDPYKVPQSYLNRFNLSTTVQFYINHAIVTIIIIIAKSYIMCRSRL